MNEHVVHFFITYNCVIFSGDANDFMMFFLNTLHLALNGTNKTSSSIIYRIFRGRMRQFTRKLMPVDASDEAKRTLMETDEFGGDLFVLILRRHKSDNENNAFQCLFI